MNRGELVQGVGGKDVLSNRAKTVKADALYELGQTQSAKSLHQSHQVRAIFVAQCNESQSDSAI